MIKTFLSKLEKNETNFNLLPFTLLLITFVVKIILFLFVKVDYWYDEIIVTEISKLSFSNLLDTVLSEPHPPGFYLLLKFFPLSDPNITRLFITILSYIILFCAIIYAKRSKIFEHFNALSGIVLFLSSYTLWEIGGNLKQDSLALPIFILTILLAVKIGKDYKSFKVQEFLLINFLVILMLFISYIYYLQSLFILFLLTVYHYKKLKIKLVRNLFFLNLIVLGAYLYFFGFSQFLTNLSRFSWFSENVRSLVNILSLHLTGLRDYGFWTDVNIIIFIFLVALSLYKKPKGVGKGVYFGAKVITLALISFSYVSFLFVRVRYSGFLLFLLTILAGWGIENLNLRRSFKYPLFLSIFIVNMIIYTTQFVRSNLFDFSIQDTQRYSYLRNKTLGFITDHPLSPYIFKLGGDLSANIVPVSLFFPRYFENAQGLDRFILQIEGYSKDTNLQEVKNLLSQNELNDFIYLLIFQERQAYYDPKRLVLSALDESCELKSTHPLDYRSVLFIYENCKFD